MCYILVISNVNYQYIMENTIAKLDLVSKIYNILEDSEQQKIKIEMEEKMSEIDILVGEIGEKIKELKVSKQKFETEQFYDLKHKNISKILFPQYSYLDSMFDNYNWFEEFEEFEETDKSDKSNKLNQVAKVSNDLE